MSDKKKKIIDEMLRVNHAGEFGAQRIYSAQIRFSKNKKLKKDLIKIAKEEFEHLEFFEKKVVKNRTRPTCMYPVWDGGGFLLGVITSFLGEKYVYACTEAVEDVIVDHYKKQLKVLKNFPDELELKKTIKKFCDDEENHRHFGEVNNSEDDLKLRLFKKFTKNLTKVAIRISKKI